MPVEDDIAIARRTFDHRPEAVDAGRQRDGSTGRKPSNLEFGKGRDADSNRRVWRLRHLDRVLRPVYTARRVELNTGEVESLIPRIRVAPWRWRWGWRCWRRRRWGWRCWRRRRWGWRCWRRRS